MDKKEILKSVLQNFINDKPEQAQADFHNYLTLKSKEITGIGSVSAPSQTQEQSTKSEDNQESQTQDSMTADE